MKSSEKVLFFHMISKPSLLAFFLVFLPKYQPDRYLRDVRRSTVLLLCWIRGNGIPAYARRGLQIVLAFYLNVTVYRANKQNKRANNLN